MIATTHEIDAPSVADAIDAPPLPGDEPFEPTPLSLETYHQLINSEELPDGLRFELLEGVLIVKMNKKRPHVISTSRANAVLNAALPSGWHIQQQDPLFLEDSEPEPDQAVVRGKAEDYRVQHPSGADVGLVCEVSESTLRRDRLKARLYGRAGIPYYWLINLASRQVECFSNPGLKSRRKGYQTSQVYTEDQSLPLVLDGVTVCELPVRDLLPPLEATPR